MADRIKVKADHETRMNWGGWFPHPIEDIDVFNRMPSSRQAEYRETRDLIRNNPQAQLFLFYDPGTRQPYPNQILYSDIEKKLKGMYMDTMIIDKNSIYVSWLNIEENRRTSQEQKP